MSSFGTPSALLKSFHIANSDKFSRTFTHGQNFELDDDIGAVAKPGSSGNNAILANYHHQGSRTTVVSNGLLMGDIAVSYLILRSPCDCLMLVTSLNRVLKTQRVCTLSGVIPNSPGPLKGPSMSSCLPFQTTDCLLPFTSTTTTIQGTRNSASMHRIITISGLYICMTLIKRGATSYAV